MPMPTERPHFLGVRFDALPMEAVIERLSLVTSDTPYGYVVTPNVDHIVRLNSAIEGPPLAPLYAKARFSLCDSRILKFLARLHGVRLSLVTGSDLTARLFREVIKPADRIAVVGASTALLEDLRQLFPDVHFLHHAPPLGLRHDPGARQAAAAFIASAKARFIFVAVGSPQQEMIAAEVHGYPHGTGIALCIGASLDFITGRERRAPKILQQLSLEWAYRLLSNPRRMWRRYLVEGPRIFMLAARYRRSGGAT